MTTGMEGGVGVRSGATMTSPAAREAFRRDRFTWLVYLLLAYFAHYQTSIGSLLPFLRADLALDYSAGALHTTVFAVGVALAGLTGARAAERFGRWGLLWGGGGGMAVGALLLALGQRLAVTLAGMFLMGWIGTYLLVMIQATLADHHGERRATALTEANIVGSLGFLLPPLLVGFFASTPVGWRGALLPGAVFWAVAFLLARRVPIPQAQPHPLTPSPHVERGSRAPDLDDALPSPAGGGREATAGCRDGGSSASGGRVGDGGSIARSREPLSSAFWTTWIVILLLAAAQWGVVAWGASFLADAVGLDAPLASALMNAYFLAVVAGRVIGSRLTRRVESFVLWAAALALAFVGFMIFWLGPVSLLNVVGLFVAGLGIANLYPLGLAVATTLAAPHSDRASARVSLATGLAILAAPQTLGAAADRVGIQNAYGLVAALMIVGAGLLSVARRRERA